ncbi:amidohydrolase family protein [Novosphingobium sp. G106]|uniref:N-acyl-D-amino-acid deacylase family protein n=1 Tax=Novosphingobium sp. G106 TaxID=2849500 RepID=UPI0020C3C4A1|nr:amidohydrolase family protein [Novosphingobium sp. G106]
MSEYDLVIRKGTVVDGLGNAPVQADVAVKDGVIVDVGSFKGRGGKEIDATGCVVTPGFIDVHTHYDGQITWDTRMVPSSNHGVTTVVMGNCGVGFAPARATDHELVIKLMEGVEDIPEVVMAEGVPWNWTSFPDYLDALEQRRSDVDFATQLPHSPLRVFVMGQRGVDLEPATDEDLREMRRLTTEAIRAGALGVSTSRHLFHRFRSGEFAPSIGTDDKELETLALGLKDAGSGVFQCIPRLDSPVEVEMGTLKHVARTSGRPVNFSLITSNIEYMPEVEAAGKEGLTLRAHFAPRPTGVLFGLDLSYHPFSLRPSYRAIADLPLDEKVAILSNPEFRQRLLAEEEEDSNPAFVQIVNMRNYLFKLENPIDYHATLGDSLNAKAESTSRPLDELIYDALLEDGGHCVLALFSKDPRDYIETMHALVESDNAVMSLGDGGAHYGMICDAGYTTYMLAQRLHGPLQHSLPQLIMAMTSRPATSVGLGDRGVLAAGYKADLNVIDLDRIAIHRPEVVRDLPAGGKRLFQRSEGYRATIVGGVLTQANDQPTGGVAWSADPGNACNSERPSPRCLRTRHTNAGRWPKY